MELTGGCFCGAIKYRVDGDPGHVTHCHCLDCRRTGATAFVTWVEFDPRAFAYTRGTPGRYATRPGVERTFCTQCGTQLTFQSQEHPSGLDVTVGSLDAPERITPQDHTWSERMLPWIHLDDGLPRHPRRRFPRA